MSEHVPLNEILSAVRGSVENLHFAAINNGERDLEFINSIADQLSSELDILAERLNYQVAVPPPAEVVGPNTYWRNAEGHLIPVESVRPKDKLQDEVVRKIFSFVLPLSEQISRFRQHTQRDIGDFVDLILQQYDTKRGGKLGNVSLTSFDDKYRVELRIARLIQFDSDLLAAKQLSDQCLAEWSEESNAHLRTIVRSAFNVDKDGKVNQQALLALLRHEIDDPRWQAAMQALRDAIKVRVTKEHLYFFMRPAPGEEFVAVTVNLAKA